MMLMIDRLHSPPTYSRFSIPGDDTHHHLRRRRSCCCCCCRRRFCFRFYFLLPLPPPVGMLNFQVRGEVEGVAWRCSFQPFGDVGVHIRMVGLTPPRRWRVRWVSHFLHTFGPFRACPQVCVHLNSILAGTDPIEPIEEGWRDWGIMVLWLRWWRVRWITHFLHRYEPCRGCSQVCIYLKVEPNPCTPIELIMQGWRDL